MKSSTKTVSVQITPTKTIRVPQGQSRRLRHLSKPIEEALKNMLTTGDSQKILIDHLRRIGATIVRTRTNTTQEVFTIIICTYKRVKKITQDLTWRFKTTLSRPAPGFAVA